MEPAWEGMSCGAGESMCPQGSDIVHQLEVAAGHFEKDRAVQGLDRPRALAWSGRGAPAFSSRVETCLRRPGLGGRGSPAPSCSSQACLRRFGLSVDARNTPSCQKRSGLAIIIAMKRVLCEGVRAFSLVA